MAEIIEAEAQSSDMDRKKRRRKSKGKSKAKETTAESEDDADFLGSSSEGSTSSDEGDESDEIEISNKEVIATLSTVYGHFIIFFTAGRLASIENHSCRQETIIKSEWQEETAPQKTPTPYGDGYCGWRCSCSALDSLNGKANRTKEGIMTWPLFPLQHADFPLQNGVKRNPIYYFYEVWDVNNEGNVGQLGDKHYRCYHGTRKIFTISKAMNHSLHSKFFLYVESFVSWLPLSGLIGHIRTHFKPMHNLYLVMKQRDTPTNDEILMASGKKPFDNSLQSDYLKIIEAEAAGIKEAFEKQKAKSAVRNFFVMLWSFLTIFRPLGALVPR